MIRGKEKLLAPVHPNVGVEREYKRKMVLLIRRMHKIVLAEVLERYGRIVERAARHAAGGSILAMDSDADEMAEAFHNMANVWQAEFDFACRSLAEYFATDVMRRTDSALRSALKKGGYTVEFSMSPAQREIIAATVRANVGLIKSIPQEYLGGVETLVMQSIQAGRDLSVLTKALTERHGVTKKRAAFIALDQNNKATAALTQARQVELGLFEAVWVHTGAKHPRPSHIKAGRDRLRYDTRKGAWIDGEWIYPGQKIRCHCISRTIVKGFA